MFGDGIADLAFGDIQTVTDQPRRIGVSMMLIECLRLTEIHGGYLR